jgi:hypothetical protein
MIPDSRRVRSLCPRTLWLLCLVVAAPSVFACKLPLFRYALERWPADQYRIVAIIDGEADEQLREALTELDRLRQSRANVEVETIDLSQLSEQQLWQVEGLESEADVPLLQVFYPARNGRSRLCWSGELNADAVRWWRDSAIRRRIVTDLTSGVSAVWILVDGSDPQENDRLEAELRSAVTKAAEEIPMPDGVIARQDAGTYLGQHPSASMDDVLRCDIPLKIEFSVLRVASDAAEEAALLAMVRGWDDRSRTDSDRAFVFPVFGRGRMIEPLEAERFSEHSVLQACGNIVAQCSCTVKTLNPGIDLLLDANWQEFMDDSVLVVDRQPATTPDFVTIPTGAAATRPLGSVESATNRRVIGIVSVAALSIFLLSVVWWFAGKRTC